MDFLPERDEQQALRMRRYLMAAGTSLLAALSFFVCALVGLLPVGVALEGSIGIAALVALFYVLFRSGLNLRFSDPSLTAEQVGAAILLLAYVMYYAGPARGQLLLFYPVAMLFGVLRLNARRLMLLAGLALGAHGTVLMLDLAYHAQAEPRHAFAEFAVLAVVMPWFAAMGGYVNRLRRRLSDSNRDLKRAVERVEQLAIRDDLTGAYNRRFVMECLGRERARAERLGASLTVCLLDLDHFKSVNDTLGHAAGDAVLITVPALVAGSLRAADIFGRFGGEEFLLILPDTPLAGAEAVAERVRAAIETARVSDLGSRRVTATLGLAEHVRGEEIAALLARADRALYAGKSAGRNRVAIAQPG